METINTEKLESLVKPLIRKSTKIRLQEAPQPQESQLRSHFGGQPYFEEGEQWPTGNSENPLSFIFQIFNTPELGLPNSIQLIQFYYDWKAFPYTTNEDGWKVKIYKNLNKDKTISINQPADLKTTRYCEVSSFASESLPDWEGIEINHQDIANSIREVVLDSPKETYEEVMEGLTGGPSCISQLGGYPSWIQGEQTPRDKTRRPMKLLFQIASEEDADIMWGDCGLIYVFYDEQDDNTGFVLQ